MSAPTPERQLACRSRIPWQSKAVLLAFVPAAGSWAFLRVAVAWPTPLFWQTTLISLAFTLFVLALRAATPGAAITGGVFTAALYLATPGIRTALWPLLALLLLTFAATRFGRRRKEALGLAEARHGRTASQVAANLGVAALTGIPEVASHLFLVAPEDIGRMALAAMLAAMAEATADTVSSELGQVLGGQPRLITTFRRVSPGTDGGVTVIGTLLGCLAATTVVLIGAIVLALPRTDMFIALAAAIAGLFIDSILGAVPERAGWLNNDAVNALSTLAAALIAAAAIRFF
ncbi:MAG TPA: DUF92 domain-containing protein [Acidobacteriaceae bacterium]|jgi:uncharacterized protein (TIGR00297 family)|nr:DUF92 domain-containing protein [Acidobacteriaceae bacterium]